MNNEAKSKITRARSQLILYKPFWGYLATHLKVIENNNMLMPTLGTDGKHLFYDSDYVNSLGDDDTAINLLKGIIAHETFHCAFGHCWRGGSREEKRWGIACDGVTNYHLKKEGFSLPDGVVNIPEAAMLSVEELYLRIKEQEEEYGQILDDHNNWGIVLKPSKGEDEGTGKKDEDKQEGEGGGQAEKQDEDKKEGEGIGGEGGEGGEEDTGKGIEDKVKASKELRDMAKSLFEGEKRMKELESKWKMNVNRAVQMAKMQGSSAGDLEDLIDNLLEPKLDWRELLRTFILSSTKSNYRIIPPSKKHLWRNMYLPSCYGENIEIAYAVDTSGSMSIDEIRDGLSELMGICQQFSDWHIYFFQCDADIQEVNELTPYDFEWPEKAKGRGGTDFRPVFDYISEHDLNITCLAYFTDGWGTPPLVRPDYPVLWVVTKEGVKEGDDYWEDMQRIGEVITL